MPTELYRLSLYIASSHDSDDVLVVAWGLALKQLRE